MFSSSFRKAMRVTAITQARSGSTRLPEKIFLEVGGQSLLEIHLLRLKRSKRIDHIIVATTTREEDLKVCAIANNLKLASFRGSENDVLDRFYQACRDKDTDYIIRITSDCPLIDPALIDLVVDTAIAKGVDYCSNVLIETFPDGQDIEVFTFSAMEKAWQEATLHSDREHVTPYIRKNCNFNGGSMFTSLNVSADTDYGNIRMTVDEKEDFDVIKNLITELGIEKTWKEYATLILSSRSIGTKNAHIKRNEGYHKPLKKEENE